MLKKLIKYGNSTALVLDRAILELLNMKEGGVVKLKTDGTSLIITPEAIEPACGISISNPAEAAAHMLQNAMDDTRKNVAPLSIALNAKLKKDLTALEADPIKKELHEKWAPGTENFDRLSEAFKQIMDKYRDEVNKLSSPESLNALNRLSEKYKDNLTCDEYLQEVCALRLQHAPLLANMDAEMIQAQREIQGLK